MIPALAVAVGAVAQGISGLGFSLVSAPFLIAALGAREGVRTALLLSSVLNVALLVRTHRDVLVREGSLLLVPAMAATPFLAAGAKRIDGRVLAVAAGTMTFLSAVALLTGVRWARAARSPVAAITAAVTSAGMNVVGSVGGPALALYSVNADWPPVRARPTLQVIFLASNLVAMLSLGLPHPLGARLPLVLPLAVGWVVGLRLAGKVPEAGARTATLVVAMTGGLIAVARAVA